ncbi:MAG: NAD-dependent epimerase/dehydratase family protein [Rhodospirillales bacterium]|nr:NAD-dependent epimerase/dehydratase family protein [Rhodospirillales bacterium]
MTVLVTGGSGFVGSAVVRYLLAKGLAVRALVRATSSRRHFDGLGAEIAIGSLDDPTALADAARGCDGLFHLAADYRMWARDPNEMFRTNVEGTRNVLRAAANAGARRIVYTSSVATLGRAADGESSTEDTPSAIEGMIGPYKRSKYLAEAEVQRLVAEEQLPVVIVNPSAPIGPRDARPTPTGRMVIEAASGRMPCYVDTGLNIVHVDDCAAGHWLAFERGRIGERYILGGENLTLLEIATRISRLTGHAPPRFRIPHGAVLPVAYAAEAWARWIGRGEPLITVSGVQLSRKKMFFSIDKAKRELDYRPRPADAAFADAVAWFRTNGYLS